MSEYFDEDLLIQLLLELCILQILMKIYVF